MSHSCFPFVIFSSFASQLRLRPGSKTVHSNQNWRSGVAVTRETHTNVWTEYAKGKDNWTLISLHTLCIIQHTCCGRPPLRTARHLIGGHSCDKIDLPLQFFGCHAPGMDTLHAMNLPQMNQLDLPGWRWGLLVSGRLSLPALAIVQEVEFWRESFQDTRPSWSYCSGRGPKQWQTSCCVKRGRGRRVVSLKTMWSTTSGSIPFVGESFLSSCSCLLAYSLLLVWHLIFLQI